MDWLTENLLWVVFGGAFLWMHLRMHRGHGGCGGGHADHDTESDAKDGPT